MTWAIVPDSDIITQGYGCTTFASEWLDPACHPASPDDNRGHRHTGIDFGHTGGGQFLFRKPVVATRSGTVKAVGANGAEDPWFASYLGPQAVCLAMEDGRYLLLGHLDQAAVNVGQKVIAGEVLGLVGTRGNSTAPHLHVEVRTDGARQTPFNSTDPTPYLQMQGDDMTQAEFDQLIANNDAIQQLAWRVKTILDNLDSVPYSNAKGEVNALKQTLTGIGPSKITAFKATITPE